MLSTDEVLPARSAAVPQAVTEGGEAGQAAIQGSREDVQRRQRKVHGMGVRSGPHSALGDENLDEGAGGAKNDLPLAGLRVIAVEEIRGRTVRDDDSR